MLSRGRAFVAPIYLFLCLILGGSAQGIWANMILQLAGVAIIAWAAASTAEEPLAPRAKQLLIGAIAAVAIVVLQLVPLPPSVWSHLAAREEIAQGFSILGLRLPPEPLSLTPALSLNSLLGIIPPLALFCAMVRLKAYRPQWLALALVAGTLAGIILGALQVATSRGAPSRWYLYEETNFGRGVGFFANRDHMATLLLATIPFLAALVAAEKRASTQRYLAAIAMTAGMAIVIVIGLALNGSLAGYGLALPVIAASALIVLPQRSPLRSWTIGVALLLMFASMVTIEMAPVGAGSIGQHASTAVDSRAELLAMTSRATRDFMPFGSGLGSFAKVYALYENPEQVTTIYAVHAHNDYLEIALELGIAGIALILLFLAWWATAVWRAWSRMELRPFARAAAIASAAVLLHSLVDFPLRTAAIAACFGMCLGLLADTRAAPPEEQGKLRRGRHVVI